MRILVTGASGLVGQALCSLAGPEWIPVSSKDADLRDISQVENMFLKHLPLDGVVHLAANVGGMFKNLKKPVDMLEDNILMNTNILKVAHQNGIQRVLCYLSTCVFPDPAPQYPVTADMLHKGHPHPSVESYGFSKRVMEIHCRAYQRQHGREYFCVVPPNIYGPHDNLNIEEAHVIPAIIHKCILAKHNQTPLVIAGDGTPMRQFVYSRDIARLTLWAFMEYKNIHVPLIMCPPGCEVSIKNIVDTVVDNVDFTGPIEYGTENGQLKKTADESQVANIIEFTPLSDGIRETVEWFQSVIVPGGTMSSIRN
jgi:GDP-L-fucose synthase